MSKEQFTLFWGGTFSQWYPSPFTIEDKEFTCAEQYMMWRKATLFEDSETAQKILNTSHPHEQKQLGRSVKNYDDSEWCAIAKDVVTIASYAKYSQNYHLMTELLATKGTLLVEASPYDKRWGIGLGMNDPKALDRTQWEGYNWLGEVLTEVRDLLIEQQKNK